ncbi:MAG: HYExAFE family protein [Gemmataceae bacterium]|nr:HYExAFE family protein [Gemmataceae bacterium]
MKSDNHYEAAFEAYLRTRGVAVVPVVEDRRSYLDHAEVKSPDFLVIGPDDARLVVDVKGRKFPGGPAGRRLMWENWSTREDVDGLTRWAGRLGDGFRGVLAFVYEVLPVVRLPEDTPDLFAHRDRLYLARGVDVADYFEHMVARSPRWGTVHLPAHDFRRLVKPFSAFLDGRTEENTRPQMTQTSAQTKSD